MKFNAMQSEPGQAREIGTVLLDATRLLRRRFGDKAKAYGLTLPQWKTLAAIRKHESITQVALSSDVDIDAMTLSGILDRMEKRGLIERFVHPDDSRAKLARLTPEGLELASAAHVVGFEVFQQAMTGLSSDDMTALLGCLTRIRDNLTIPEQDSAQPGKDS